ncbi:hypothetical protein SAMN02745751_00309 [Dethiosulfatibacter aminovorans DSM 17477]|uniref:Uncharacterized protein n=1 Tax=Dethiosulfatibacter aminovorans DSM 17477 TaxID=1121476 RepID=A0A1M6B025_9FIRM|nr:hypothetical protein [Dethiosulfatibacter aminovorans]SHI42062.1 hypothetical protein SAMN02745751_00309 [Dethiosulfatibacter aminovorans DSM 17477]
MANEMESNNDINLIIKIKYQQNQAVQGSAKWVEKGRTVNFRSFMELFYLIVEACDDLEIRSWENKLDA